MSVTQNPNPADPADLLAQREAELLKAKTELADFRTQMLNSEKMASIGQLAAGIAHEINNPIGYVISNLTSLERYLHDLTNLLDHYERHEKSIADPQARQELENLKADIDLPYLRTDLRDLMAESKEGIGRVKKIVQDLKDLSHVGEDVWDWADLHQALNTTLNIINNEIKTKAEVRREFGDIPRIRCKISRLNQVFLNMLINSAHAIESGGLITVATGFEAGMVWVRFSDNGSGIDSGHLARIFDAFFTTKPVGKGTGLGLYLAHEVVKAHGGRIDVQSTVGVGTTFTIWLAVDAGGDRA